GERGPLCARAGGPGRTSAPGAGKLSDKVTAAISKLSERPIQFIVNTSMHAEHVGGNAKLGAAGADPSLPGSFFDLQSPAGATGLLNDPAHHATVIAQNNVTVRLQAAKAPADMI
ncbi:MAG: hypothetical protein DMG17_16700, partial [Acidobacteria bacterium]